MQNNNHHPPTLEITIISAQDLMIKKAAFAFSHRRLRPFVTISATTTAVKMYETKVDDKGGVNPTWGDKFKLYLDHTFFHQRYPGIYLHLYTKHLLMGRSQLGWCLIPAADMAGRFAPVGSTRFLSYRLRARDGSRGQGVVNVSVRLEGSLAPSSPFISHVSQLQDMHENDHSVIGIPVKLL